MFILLKFLFHCLTFVIMALNIILFLYFHLLLEIMKRMQRILFSVMLKTLIIDHFRLLWPPTLQIFFWKYFKPILNLVDSTITTSFCHSDMNVAMSMPPSQYNFICEPEWWLLCKGNLLLLLCRLPKLNPQTPQTEEEDSTRAPSDPHHGTWCPDTYMPTQPYTTVIKLNRIKCGWQRPVIPELKRLKQENTKFKAALYFMVIPHLKNKKKMAGEDPFLNALLNSTYKN